MRFFAVVFVLAVLGERVVALDRGFERLFGEPELAGELFNRVGLHYKAFFNQTREHLFCEDAPENVGISAVFKGVHARAPVHLELLGLFGPIGVKERVVAVPLLIFVSVKNVFVGARFVEEALAVSVDLEPRLRADPEEPRIALLGGFGAGRLINTQRAAVKEHRRMGFIHRRTRPKAGTNAVTACARQTAVAADDAQIPGLKGFEHLVVLRVAAGGDDHALLGDVAHKLAVARFGDAARHAARLLFKLHHAGVVVKAGAEFLGVINQHDVAVKLLAVFGRLAGPARRVADGKVFVAGMVVLVA